jgi:hypothetical protein
MSSLKTLLVVLAVSGAVLTAIVLGLSSGSERRGPERSETCGFGDCQEYYVGVSAQGCAALGGRWAIAPWERHGRWFCFTGRPLSRAGRE